MLRGEWADPRLGHTSFGEWADRWLVSTVNLRANTKAGYRSILRQYLRPAFGSYPLARIDVLAVRTWLAKLEADGIGQRPGPRRTGCSPASWGQRSRPATSPSTPAASAGQPARAHQRCGSPPSTR